MSEFGVYRTADTIPALKYCLTLDDTRIAGGKPDYRGNNHLISWRTDETYGPIDDLKAENAQLRQQLADVTESMGRVEERCAKLRELLQRALTSHNKMCTNRGTCAGCLLFNAKPFAPACPIVSVTRDARELSVEVD